MARRPRGQLYRVKTKAGQSYGVRFRWNGRRYYRTLGYSVDGMTRRDAEREIERLMAAVWTGAWDPEEDRRRAAEPEPEPEVTFDRFAMEWFDRRKATGGRDGRGLSESGDADLAWALDHLRAWFGGFRLSEITVEEVEQFVHAKRTLSRGGSGPLADRPLSPTSVRKFVRVLRSILATAVRYDRIPRNVADDVKVPASHFRGSYLDRAEEVAALLDAADEIDRKRRLRRGHGRALLATLCLAGLRIDEALSLRWRDVDLAAGRLCVTRSKTEAGEREVDLLPLLRDELLDLAARRGNDRDALVFATSRGGKESASNVRNRLLGPAVTSANARLTKRGADPLPERVTPHSLRRTFASVLVALGRDPAYVMAQLGHTDAAFTLRVYARVIRLRDGERDRLRALVEGDAVTLGDLDAAAARGQGESNTGSTEEVAAPEEKAA